MKAAVLRGHRIVVETLPDPTPRPGQLLVRPLFTGICGSDLSLRKQMAAAEEEALNGSDDLPIIVPGHEFTGEVLDTNKLDGTGLRPGDIVTALPFTEDADGPQTIGISPGYTGGLATLSCIDAVRTFRVPDSVPADLGALTEPLAVGLHASRLADRNRGPNLVIGCGPVGQAVILALKLEGRGPILATDLSAERRAIAEELGADIVIDPAEGSAFDHWEELGFEPRTLSPLLEREFAELPPGANIFECTGASGMFSQIISSVPPHSHIVVAGVCPHDQTFTPLDAVTRELHLTFSLAYRPTEFAESLDLIRHHPELIGKLITSRRPLSETEEAFDALAKNPKELKVLIKPTDR